MKIRIGTRRSRLALAQTEQFVRTLNSTRPDIETQIVEISSRGDRITDRPIAQLGGKGVFSFELEERILSGDIDAAVHSAKDLDIELPEGLEISAVLKRGDHRDVLVLPKGASYSPDDRLIIGTGSIRRRENIRRFYPNAVFMDIRGNVETRLNKLAAGEYDGIILAAAGLERLGMLCKEKDSIITENREFSYKIFEADEFVPAACQGIIAAETKKGSAVSETFREISHKDTLISFETEREFLRLCGGDCQTPAGIFTEVAGENMGIICSADGKNILTSEGKIKDRYDMLKGMTAKK